MLVHQRRQLAIRNISHEYSTNRGIRVAASTFASNPRRHVLSDHRPPLPLDRPAKGIRHRAALASPRDRRAHDAGAGLSEQGMHRPETLARERADHLDRGGSAEILDRRRRRGGSDRARGRGAAHSVERTAHGGGARGYARRGRLQPHSSGLARSHRRLLPREREEVAMDLGIRGKIALVAASSRGLGRASAEALAAEGVELVLCARGEAALRATAEDIRRNAGVRVVDVVADVATQAGFDAVLSAADREFGRVDILVTNGGGPPAGPFETHALAAWDAAVRANLTSVVELVRGVLPGMRERRWGRIVNVTSIAVKQPVDNLILSNSIRAAVTGFARTLSNEVATDGITVNNILPGYTRTERVEELADATAKKENLTRADILSRFEQQIPMRRLGEPKEFAALAAFLASERASYITGQSIAVDGGWIKSVL